MIRSVAALLVLTACAAEAPPTSFDDSAGIVVVEIGPDGFVQCGGRRMPLEACVLELRQRARGMTSDELGRFVVQLRTVPQPPRSEAEANAARALNRLLGELQIMGVRQVLCD